ncbi:MAG: social motility TPR repeat lipoprotein Tgl [Myxococcota bacterium]
MFTIDERLKGLPAVKEQVVQLYQSLNQPHLAVPGRKAGPASGYVLGLRGPSGFAVFVYLYMPDSGECAVYVPSNGTVAAEQYQSEEAEALGFVESMGFIMDNLNFRGRPIDEQEGMIRSLPIFQREPPAAGTATGSGGAGTAKPSTGKSAGVVQLGKLFSAFCLALCLAGCAHIVTEKDREQAQIHYDLAVQNLVKQPQTAFSEVEESLKLNPEMHEAWHVRGLLLHHAFGRLDEALAAYMKALELKPDFSEARTNLGNLYIDMKRYDDAIAQYDKALNDVLYGAPFIAHGNMGWAYYKKGDLPQALDHLKAAITINPKYCLGHLKLGQLYEEQQNTEESCKYFGRYKEYCPERADAWQHDGLCHAKKGELDEARKSFDTCLEKATTDDQKDLCKQLKGQLAP